MSKVAQEQLEEKDEWRTPPDLINDLKQATKIHTDPCAASDTMIGDIYNHTYEDDGFESPWIGTVFINPPFSQKTDWLDEAMDRLDEDHIDTIVFITPDSTDVKSWWHGYIAEHARVICFCKGRVNYYDENGNQQKGATFGTAISVFGDVPDSLVAVLQEYGHVVKTVTDGDDSD